MKTLGGNVFSNPKQPHALGKVPQPRCSGLFIYETDSSVGRMLKTRSSSCILRVESKFESDYSYIYVM